MAVLLTILLPVIYAFQSLFLKLFSMHYKPKTESSTTTVFCITYGLFTGIVTLIIMGFRFNASPTTWLFGCLNAVTLLIYNEAMLQCTRRGSFSFQMLVNLFGGILLPLFVGAVFQGERLSALQLGGIALILVSVVLINGGELKPGGNKGFLLWCLVLFTVNGLYGVWMNAQQAAAANTERNEMIVLTFAGMALLSVILQLFRDPSILATPFRLQKKAAPCLVACCAVAATAVHLLLYALSLIPASVLYATNNGGILMISVLFSRLFFGEKLKIPQWIGMALATVAIVLLSI